MAGFISSQRTEHGVPHAVACRAPQVSESWHYKWRDRQSTDAQTRRAELDDAIRRVFGASGGAYGSPRVTQDLQAAGWRVGENTVARRMAALGLAGRPPKRRRSLTRQGRRPAAPDRDRRQFTAPAPDVLWCGDITEIVTDQGSAHPRPSTRPAGAWACSESMGWVGSVLDNAAAEAFNSTIKVRIHPPPPVRHPPRARLKISTWIVDFYNLRRRHSACDGMSPIDYERFMAEVRRAEAA